MKNLCLVLLLSLAAPSVMAKVIRLQNYKNVSMDKVAGTYKRAAGGEITIAYKQEEQLHNFNGRN